MVLGIYTVHLTKLEPNYPTLLGSRCRQARQNARNSAQYRSLSLCVDICLRVRADNGHSSEAPFVDDICLNREMVRAARLDVCSRRVRHQSREDEGEVIRFATVRDTREIHIHGRVGGENGTCRRCKNGLRERGCELRVNE